MAKNKLKEFVPLGDRLDKEFGYHERKNGHNTPTGAAHNELTDGISIGAKGTGIWGEGILHSKGRKK